MRPFLIASLFAAAFLVFPPAATAQVPFQVETVDSAGDTGIGASIALDGHGRPHIAYRAASNGHLKYATAAVDVRVEKRSAGSVKWLYRR